LSGKFIWKIVLFTDLNKASHSNIKYWLINLFYLLLHTHTHTHAHAHTSRRLCIGNVGSAKRDFHSIPSRLFNSTHLCRLLQWLSLGAFMYKRDGSLLRLYFISSSFPSFFFVCHIKAFFHCRNPFSHLSLSVRILSSFRQTVTHSVSILFYSRKFLSASKKLVYFHYIITLNHTLWSVL